MPETLDKFAAGELIRKRREEKGLTQEQVVEATTVPVAAYLSELENGKVSVGRSKHFPSLAAYLGLSEDDVRAINPAAVITLAAPQPPSSALSAAAHYPDFEEEEEPIEDALAEAVRLYGDLPDFEGLTDPVMQRALQGIDFRQRPQTPQEWLAKFLKYRDDLRSSDA